MAAPDFTNSTAAWAIYQTHPKENMIVTGLIDSNLCTWVDCLPRVAAWCFISCVAVLLHQLSWFSFTTMAGWVKKRKGAG
jgi:hypothetical protein